MRRRVTLGLGVAGIFLAGLLAGGVLSGVLPAFASNNASSATGAANTKGDYCALYEQTLASKLNVKTADLEQANSEALQTVIKQMYADGKITSQQESKLLQQATSLKSGACSRLAALAGKARHGGAGKANAALAGARQAIEAQVAPTLHLTAAQLDSDLKAGQTVSDIAAAQKVNLSDVSKAYLSAVQSQLSKAVSAGMLTQAQSDALYSRVQQAANAGHFPLLERGGIGAAAALGQA